MVLDEYAVLCDAITVFGAQAQEAMLLEERIREAGANDPSTAPRSPSPCAGEVLA